MTRSRCRGCGHDALTTFCDLGVSPLANSYVDADAATAMEPFFPLTALVCECCLLVQLQEFAAPEDIFTEYPYFSSWSTSWVEHARIFAAYAIGSFSLGSDSLVVELASNDGYLLQWFAAAGIPVLGVEPARNVAEVAVARGVPTISEFFGAALGERLRAEHGSAALIVANNVLAHVPDLHDFVAGIAALLAERGRATVEFPHLLPLVEEVQFDTIYHEHFSYFSLHALVPVLETHGLRLVDVEQLPTHGGSLRLHLAHAGAADVSPRVGAVQAAEHEAGLDTLATYQGFGECVAAAKRSILRFLLDLADSGSLIAAYGAPAKGNTLLNYCGIGPELLPFTVDANPTKQGTLLPGSRIPVLSPEDIARRKPDVVVLLPWNLRDELEALLGEVASWGGRLAVLRPEPAFLP